MRLRSAQSQAFPSFTLAVTGSQLRLPEYRSSYRLRYHPYAGQRTLVHHIDADNDYYPEYDFSLPVAAHDLAGAVLEPFSQGMQSAAPMNELDADIPGNVDKKRGHVLILVIDCIRIVRNLFGNVQLTKDDNDALNDNHPN